MALITPIPPLSKMEASQDHLLPALAPCLGLFSSESSPSHRLRCCVSSALAGHRGPGYVAGLGLRLEHLCLSPRNSLCCLQSSLGGEKVGGEALHRTQTLARQSQEGWRRGKGRWGAGGRTGKPVCGVGMCGGSPGLFHICPHHAEVQGEGFSLWPSHCWAGSGGWNFPTCKPQRFAASASPPSHGFASPGTQGAAGPWAQDPAGLTTHLPILKPLLH